MVVCLPTIAISLAVVGGGGENANSDTDLLGNRGAMTLLVIAKISVKCWRESKQKIQRCTYRGLQAILPFSPFHSTPRRGGESNFSRSTLLGYPPLRCISKNVP